MKVFISVLFLLFSYNLASACSCMQATEEGKEKAIKESSVIFYGKIISVNAEENQIKAKFQVLKSWKGLEIKEIIVTTASSSAACGVNFTEGETKLIYAYGSSPSTSSCSMLMVDEEKLRKTLGEGKSFENMPPKPDKQESEKPKSEEKPSKHQESEGFLSRFWKKIKSIFS